jgi:hypothetical protein
VATRRWVLALPLVAVISMLVGCSGGSTANVQNPPPPPTSNVCIALQGSQCPATSPTTYSVPLNSNLSLSATVTNDPSSAGVDWSLTCSIPVTTSSPNPCGTLSALHTASAAATTYTPPSTISGNSFAVNIVAFATADHTQNVGAAVTVTGFGSTLKGTYVLQAQGIDANGFAPYQFAGVIYLDGNGNIASPKQGQSPGEQIVNLYDLTIGSPSSQADTITGGSYFVGPDGRGTITINTANQNVGVNGVETFSFVALSNSQALIAQADFFETARGTMDLQTGTAAPSGGYAFVVNGIDTVSEPMAMGGVFKIDSANTISGTGSLIDQNLAGTLTLKQGLSGTVSAPDAFGAVTLNLNVPTLPTFATIQFTGYIVDATHMKIIESDNVGGGGSGSTAGVAIGQGSATGTFLGDAAFSGTYVYGVTGVDLATTQPSTYNSVGLFNADGSGGVSNGFTDTFLQLSGVQGASGSQIRAAFTGTYIVDSKGTGRVRVALGHFVPAPVPGIAPVFFFYLTGNGNPPLVLDAGDFSPARNYPSLGTGTAYLQSSSSLTFSGKYGFSITQVGPSSESDGTGQITVDATAGTLSGTADINAGFGGLLPTGTLVSGTFQPPSNGRFAGALTSDIFDFSPFAADFYVVDQNRGFFVETDLVDPNFPSGVVSFGTYAVRTPVCSGCP